MMALNNAIICDTQYRTITEMTESTHITSSNEQVYCQTSCQRRRTPLVQSSSQLGCVLSWCCSNSRLRPSSPHTWLMRLGELDCDREQLKVPKQCYRMMVQIYRPVLCEHSGIL
jgi:hypothetical protein